MLISMFNLLTRIEDNQSNNIKNSKVIILDINSRGDGLRKEKEGTLDLKLIRMSCLLCACFGDFCMRNNAILYNYLYE
jgi:hypothetical protein